MHDGRRERHPNTTYEPALTHLNKAQEDAIAFNSELADAYVYGEFDVFDRSVSVKYGRQVISWGESLINVINSLNVVSPPDAVKVRLPGFNLKEIFRPVNALNIGFDITDNLSSEVFYLTEWRNVHIDPAGSFFSTADAAEAGGTHVMLDFGKGIQDPYNIADERLTFANAPTLDSYGTSCINPDSIGSATHPEGYGDHGGTLGRTACRVSDKTPDKKNEWGIKFKYYAEWLNDTDFGFYYMNLHSRLPYGGFHASITGLDVVPTEVSDLFSGLGLPLGLTPGLAEAAGALGVADTVTLALEYPEDIEIFGFSFNTTLGDISLSAEYAYRPSLPVQVGGADLVFYALSPAFGDSRAAAIPSQVEFFRNGPAGRIAEQGEYIHGYERLNVGQGDAVIIWANSSSPLGADQWLVIGEAGFTKIFGMPSRDEIHFDGSGVFTHQSQGRDEAEAAGNPLALIVLNPERQTTGWTTSFSWGYKLLSIMDYPNLFWGTQVKLINGFFHDVNGTAPSPGPNFIEGRKQILTGVDFIRGPYSAEVRYVVHTGGGQHNLDKDRDNVSLAFKYTF